MLQTLRKIWVLLFVVAAVVTIVWLFRQEASEFTWPRLVSGKFLLYACITQLVFWWFISVMWIRVTRVVVDTDTSVWRSFQQLVFLGLGKYVPGKIWGVTARGAQMRSQGVGVTHIAVATFYEQWILMHGALVACMVLLAVQHPGVTTIAIAAGALFSTLAGAQLSALAVRTGGWLASRVGADFPESELASIRSVQYFGLVCGYAVAWVLIGVVFLFLYRAFFAASTDVVTALGLVFANTVAIVAGILAVFAPGGIGVREAVGASLLTAWMPLPEATALVLLFRIWITAMDGIAGLAVIPILRDSLRK